MALDPTWQPPDFREKEHSYSWIFWLLGIVVFAGLILYIVYLMQTPIVVPTQTTTQETTTSEQPAATTQQTAPIVPSSTPEFSDKCTALLGFVPGSGRFDKETKTMRVMLKNNGKVSAEGTYFEFINPSKSVFKQNQDLIEPGAEKTYDVPFTQLASELGLTSVRSFYIYPIQNGKACSNQKLVVFKTEEPGKMV